MAGSFVIQFQRGGNAIPISDYLPNAEPVFERGIVLDGESSAFPRPFALNLLPLDPGTRILWEKTQQRKGWVNRYDMDVTKVSDGLHFEGTDGAPLPTGSYQLDLRVGELPLINSRRTISIPGSGTETVTFDAEPGARSIRLTRVVDDFDDEARRILQDDRSELDNLGAVEWLNTRRHQDRRKACLLNILTKLEAVPSRDERLGRLVRNVFHCEMDRIYCAVEPEFFNKVSTTFNEDAMMHPTHERLKAKIPHDEAARFELKSYREDVESSMQAVVAIPPEDLPDRTHYADLDIDKNNPSYDALRFLLHIGDLFQSGKTNHFDIRSTLVGGDTGDFVYYDVE